MKLTSFALIETNDTYLLIREASVKWKGKWFFPGGKIRKNESPEQAVVRETEEEAACTIFIKGLLSAKYTRRWLNNRLCFFYYAKAMKKEIKNYPDKHSMESRWFKYEELLSLPLRENALDIINTYRSLKKSHSLN